MKKKILMGGVYLMSVLFSWATDSEGLTTQPSAQDILQGARQVAVLQHQQLQGFIKKGGEQTQVALFLQGEDIQFQIADLKTRTWSEKFHMRLGEDQFELYEMQDNKTKAFPVSKLGHPIRGSDLSYEDLAMRFLYWPEASIEGVERIKNQPCWKLRIINPGNGGNYKIVYAWIHQKAGALMQVVGYNRQGKPLKRFQITKLMRIGNEYTLKNMRIDTLNPANQKSVGVTYLEFEKPRKMAPRGLR